MLGIQQREQLIRDAGGADRRGRVSRLWGVAETGSVVCRRCETAGQRWDDGAPIAVRPAESRLENDDRATPADLRGELHGLSLGRGKAGSETTSRDRAVDRANGLSKFGVAHFLCSAAWRAFVSALGGYRPGSGARSTCVMMH